MNSNIFKDIKYYIDKIDIKNIVENEIIKQEMKDKAIQIVSHFDIIDDQIQDLKERINKCELFKNKIHIMYGFETREDMNKFLLDNK